MLLAADSLNVPGSSFDLSISGGGVVVGGGIPTAIRNPFSGADLTIGGTSSGGIGIEAGGFGAQICPPGTACSGPSIQLPGGVSGCLGSCRATVGTGTAIGTGNASGTGGTLVPSGTCDVPTQAYCAAVCGTTGDACRAAGSCKLANGRAGTLNKSGYYLKNGQYVPPGTRCVKRRRMNPGNGKAATRAARRVTAAIKHQDRLVKAMKKTMRGR